MPQITATFDLSVRVLKSAAERERARRTGAPVSLTNRQVLDWIKAQQRQRIATIARSEWEEQQSDQDTGDDVDSEVT